MTDEIRDAGGPEWSAGAPAVTGQSPSIVDASYWWYAARERMMRAVFASHVRPTDRVLDVGSADGPSARWLRDTADVLSMDVDPAGLRPGDVCASAEQLPFADETFDVVAVFDVIEHLRDPSIGLGEIRRALRPGGTLLVSVPAYTWAWTDFDVDVGHHRRYTRRRLVEELRRSGFTVRRATHAFAATLPFFAADRARARLLDGQPSRVEDGDPPAVVTSVLGFLGKVDATLLRWIDLPFGSSVFAVAERPVQG